MSKVIIIGAGISGLTMALALKKRGFDDFTIYDKSDSLGGTWKDNAYPGCRCDIPAIVYSHSKYLNPNWSQEYPPRFEILAYWQKIAEQEDLLRHVKFGHTFIQGKWDDSTSQWQIVLSAGDNDKPLEISCKVLISGIGRYSQPETPDIEGIKNFPAGKAFHSARWPAELSMEDLKNKTVCVLGNGCSGVQLVGTIGKDPDIKVVHIARRSRWLFPSPTNPPDGPKNNPKAEYKPSSFIKNLFMKIKRVLVFYFMELRFFAVPSDGFLRPIIEKKVTKYLNTEAPPEMVKDLTPAYPLFANRIIRDQGYLGTLRNQNVTLLQDSIAKINEDGNIITASNQQVTADYIVFATGFIMVDHELNLTGRDGLKRDLDKEGMHGSDTYHAMVKPGYPNYFMMYGANSASVHTSTLYIIEVQAEYIAQCILAMKEYDIKALEIKEDATSEYIKWLDKRLDGSIWTKVPSWNRSGKDRLGRVFVPWPAPVTLYWWMNKMPIWKHYIGGEKVKSGLFGR